MSITRSTEFASFVNNGQRQRFGELVMVGNKVFSYDMCIAEVHRESRLIYIDRTKVSATTSSHQRAIEQGFYKLPAGWELADRTNING